METLRGRLEVVPGRYLAGGLVRRLAEPRAVHDRVRVRLREAEDELGPVKLDLTSSLLRIHLDEEADAEGVDDAWERLGAGATARGVDATVSAASTRRSPRRRRDGL